MKIEHSHPTYQPRVIVGPKEWGPSGWMFLQSIASAYPDHPTKEEQEDYLRFFSSVGPVLPCKICRPHYHEYLQTHPLQKALTSKDALVSYFFHFHNHVNQRLGKPQKYRTSLPQFFQKIFPFHSHPNKEEEEGRRK